MEFKRFLYLLAIESKAIVKERSGFQGHVNGTLTSIASKYTPSPAIDRLWRILVANDALYAKICMKLFNGYRFERDSLEASNSTTYLLTAAKIKEEFPNRVESLWPATLPSI